MLTDGPNSLDKGDYWFLIANKSVLETRNIPRNKPVFVGARDGHTSFLRRASSRDELTSLICLFLPHLLKLWIRIWAHSSTPSPYSFLKTGSHIALASFELAIELSMTLNCCPSCLHLVNAEVTGMCHHTQSYATPGIEPRASCMLGKYSTNLATFPVHTL